ncbi:methyl-accepting chemotaxis protein [Marinobacterium arenosum]|uniref:methyl-accepting chemotaxis protein n=1 Tax=Marinobacterium arenosum TaxID=2862496 RepID=UPI001C9660AE|nr:methyl-accepting chemotaxis protein [Marinobacterium arenosum]MBY4675485.1 methyl-accepting chemotaxis protein [Marinobacterium arenosum]
MKIQNKIILTICAAFLILISASTSLNLSNMYSSSIERVTTIEIPAALGEVKGKISSDFSPSIITSKAMADNTFIQRWLRNGEKEEQLSDVTDYLSEIMIKNNTDAVFLTSERTKKFYYEKGVFKTLSTGDSHDQWYFDFVRSGDEYEANLSMDEVTGNLSVFINYRIDTKEGFLGVIGIGSRLDHLTKTVKDYKIGKTGIVYLVDNNGKIQLHGDKEKVGKTSDNYLKLKSNGDKKDIVQVYSKEIQDDLLVTSTTVPSLGLILVAEIPESEVYDDINEALLSSGILSTAIAFVFLAILSLYTRHLFKPINDVATALVSIGQGEKDLSQRLQYLKNDEAGALASGFNTFVKNIEEVISTAISINKGMIETVVKTSESLSHASDCSNQQEKMIQHVATAIHELEASVTEVAESAQAASVSTENVRRESDQGQAVIDQAVSSISGMSDDIVEVANTVNSLASDVEAIASVLDVIQGISEQTNLLALNAAIEAARAGEHGRGFAVVADEVRSLSLKTKESTEEISAMIQRLDKGANDAVQAMEKSIRATASGVSEATGAGESFLKITGAVSEINDRNYQIASATHEQTAVTSSINESITSISEVSRNAADASVAGEKRFAEIEKSIKESSLLLEQFKVTNRHSSS